MIRVFCIVAVAVTLAGCLASPSTATKSSAKRALPVVSDSAPTVDAATLNRLANLPDPIVKEEFKSKYGNGPVYTVFGRSYQVMERSQGFTQEGVASWYGTKFHGNRTSSGEPFDMYGLSAAHRHLPLPCYARVTNLNNGRSTIVKVNDRGPFHSDRVIDLSFAAAVKLGFSDTGTAPVRVEVLTPRSEPDAYLVQAGAFREFENADRLHGQLQQLTGVPGVVVKTSNDGYYRVRLGPVRAGQELERIQELMATAKYSEPHLIPTAITD